MRYVWQRKSGVKRIAILGSTGSIGINTLKVIDNLGGYKPECLTAYSNLRLLARQANQYKPSFLGIATEGDCPRLIKRLKYKPKKIFFGPEGLKNLCQFNVFDIVVIAIVGCAGLIPLIESIKSNKKIALANKESLVSAGEIIMNLLKKSKASLIPVDSEHNAIFQCLRGENIKKIKRIILTASGGPFNNYESSRLKSVTPRQALTHPKWRMGKKISIDSATMMNKGLEVIEAKWLFGVEVNKIEVLIHKEAIIHSMIEFIDGNVKALVAPPDMKLPIQYALTFPERQISSSSIKFSNLKMLSFAKPDLNKFPALKLCFKAAKTGGTMPTVLNASNEVAVSQFLNGKILFTDIPSVIRKVMSRHKYKKRLTLESILEADAWARREALQLCKA
jgi:1-deoxy-D-xylulose-5-phosphate reductoisomerase